MRNLLVKILPIAAAIALCGNAWAGGNPANGKAISEKVCVACHGVDGSKPTAPENPILAGQYADYIEKALSDYKSGKRANPIMKSFADQLKKKDIEDLAAWFSSQKSELHFQR
jgi:cytochrome c553